MGKRKLLSVPRSAVFDGATTIPVTFVTRPLLECATTRKCILQLLGNLKQRPQPTQATLLGGRASLVAQSRILAFEPLRANPPWQPDPKTAELCMPDAAL